MFIFHPNTSINGCFLFALCLIILCSVKSNRLNQQTKRKSHFHFGWNESERKHILDLVHENSLSFTIRLPVIKIFTVLIHKFVFFVLFFVWILLSQGWQPIILQTVPKIIFSYVAKNVLVTTVFVITCAASYSCHVWLGWELAHAALRKFGSPRSDYRQKCFQKV